MRTIRLSAIFGTLAPPVLLGIVSSAAGLGVTGWIVGLLVGWTATALLAVARLRSAKPAIFPADWVTLCRALLGAGVAGLVADSFQRSVSITALITLAAVAMALDAVDGPVARRTDTATPLGARIDGEVDAFLILLLSIEVYLRYGSLACWVLAIGAARYLFLLGGWLVPWLAAPLPPRYWRKVVAAVQGITLAVAVSGLVNAFAALIAVGGALALLLESFGRDVVWLFRTGARPVTRRVTAAAMSLLSAVIVWGALVAPDRLGRLSPTAFVRIPIEGLVLVALGLFLPARARNVMAAVAGSLIGLITIIKVLDIGFYVELDRPFDPVVDWSNLQPAIGVVRDSIGDRATDIFLAVLALLAVLTLVLITAATVRVCSATARYRNRSLRGVAALGVVCAVSAPLAVQLVPGDAFASTTTADVAVSQVRDAAAAIQDQQRFETAIHSADPEAQVPGADLLTGLRGKDVLIVFVESYGQVAVQGSSFSPSVDAALRSDNASLARAGWRTQSAWLSSPTFGGISWLAHSTLQSGLWIDNQQRYDQLVASNRFTLSDAFNRAGWHTVSDIPSDDEPWPQGRTFYHYDALYNSLNVGYLGPKFSYAKVPDQYTLNKFGQLALGSGHSPVMAEIDLDSSHEPWTPLPHMVPWNRLGNGSIYSPMATQGLRPAVAFRSDATVQRLYGKSIRYSLQALTSWVARLNDPNLVMVMLGDHQPATVVSGNTPTHSVPISIVARDPSVFRHIASWHWQGGLRPGRTAPLEQMDAFRNQFLDAFNARSSRAITTAPASQARH
ncbi:MAG TPA: CDP-alcohol phosphatidyltransferase family protein [Jatrophihabitans sp.]|nr:CDP-alcohol phosphatidyltransferase family protein [Jatrophihabitans sp.]